MRLLKMIDDGSARFSDGTKNFWSCWIGFVFFAGDAGIVNAIHFKAPFQRSIL
jgi:hypothetical protein